MSNHRKNTKNLPKLNDSKHFNIINDIKIEERKNNNNNDIKNKNINLNENKENINNVNILNHNNFINGEGNINFAALFRDDIELNYNEKKKGNNNSDVKKNNYIHNNDDNLNLDIIEDLKDIGASFFDSLKEESNKNRSQKKKTDNNYDENFSVKSKGTKTEKDKISKLELLDKLIIRQNDPIFKEELRKKGLNFNYQNKIDSDEKNNFFKCPICFENTNNSNIKPIAFDCGHCICNICVNNYEKNDENLVCPHCYKDLKLNEKRTVFI